MKKIIFSFLLAITFSLAVAQQGDKTYFGGGNICQTEPWQLIFHDEFSGNSIDQSKWYTFYPYGPNNSALCEFCRTHGESQVYLDPNVVVSDGTLKLIAKRESFTWFGSSKDYTSGMIHSKINNFKYGKFEIRCKIPSGTGFWPAFWTFGGDEIDIFEFGTDVTTEFYSNVHNWNWKGNHLSDEQTHTLEGTDFSASFHTYAIEWDHFYLKWFLDGMLIRTVPKFFTLNGNAVSACNLAAGPYIINPLFPTDPASVIANLAIGGPFTPMPNASTPFPSQFEIDYIRVYQRQPQSGFANLCESQNLISGLAQICDGQNYTYQFVGPSGAVTSWSVAPNLEVISSNSTSITVKASSNLNGQAWIKATFAPSAPCPQTEVTKLIGLGKPVLSVIQDKTDWCSVFLTADIQPNNLMGTWTIIRDGVSTTSTGLNEMVMGSNTSNTYFYYTYSVSNECGVSEISGDGVIDQCDRLIQFMVAPNPANDIIQIDVQGEVSKDDIEDIYIVSQNTGFIQEFNNPELHFTINTQNYSEGTYYLILKVAGVDQVFTKMLQIQR